MQFEKVTSNNLNIAIEIQHKIFPLENGSQDLKDSVTIMPEHQFLYTYWLCKVKNNYIGICGLYAYKEYPLDAWLGWFGVTENERGKGYATEILNFCMQQAKELGFENLRLYTDEQDNAGAVKLYKKLGMISEEYNNKEDMHFEISKTLIFSKNLNNKPTSLWNNKNLYLKLHDEKNK